RDSSVPCQVERNHCVTGGHQVAREHTSHVPETDHSDDRHAQRPSFGARTADRARFAAFPAGAPQYAATWKRSSSNSALVTPVRSGPGAGGANPPRRRGAAVMASTRRLRSLVLSAPPRAHTPQAMEVT